MDQKFENDNPEEFEIASELKLNSGISELKWCTNMDLVGVITDNNVFEIYRVYMQIRKVKAFSQSEAELSNFIFSPDGNSFALGTCSNGILLRKTDTHPEDFNLDLDELKEKIVLLSWIDLREHAEIQALSPFQSGSIAEELTGFVEINTSQKPGASNEEITERLNLYKECSKNYNLLLGADSSGAIQLYLNGFIPMLSFSLRELIGGIDQSQTFTIKGCLFERDYSKLLFSTIVSNPGGDCSVGLQIVDTSFINTRMQEILVIQMLIIREHHIILDTLKHSLVGLTIAIER